MMLFELYLEQRRLSDKSFQEGSDIEKMNEETNVLLRILLYIHDLDAVHAINQSHSLESQGAIYAHDEKWLEALTTIEVRSIFQTIFVPKSNVILFNVSFRVYCNQIQHRHRHRR